MRTRFVKRKEGQTKSDCELCCYKGECDIKAPKSMNCKGGHRELCKPRASKYERLLKAILSAYTVHKDGDKKELLDADLFEVRGITEKQQAELIAIKEKMK